MEKDFYELYMQRVANAAGGDEWTWEDHQDGVAF